MTNNEDSKYVNFKQLGLLVGSFTDLEEDPNNELPERLDNLLWWTLWLPPVFLRPQLGVSADGFALIYYTVLQAKKRKEKSLRPDHEADAEELRKVLIRLGTSRSTLQQIENPQNPYCKESYDYSSFADNIVELQIAYRNSGISNVKAVKPYFAEVSRRRNYIWLNNQDYRWWIKATKKTLSSLIERVKDKKLDQEDVMMLGERLECCVFAPLDISQRFPIPKAVNGKPLPSDIQDELTDLVKNIYDARQKAPPYLYLSWDLFAIDYWRVHESEKLLYRTMLALWANWPCDQVWAPDPPVGLNQFLFSLKDSTSLLTKLLPDVRRYFLRIKDAYQLGLTEQKFDESQTCYPPTFYFVDPISPLSTTTEYIKHPSVHHLLGNFLGCSDPYANTLSWSTLEGSIATVRGETLREDHYKPRYLLLPLSSQSSREIAADLDRIVDFLSLREYSIAMEAVEIHKRRNDVAQDSTIELTDRIIHRIARAVPALSDNEREDIIEEFAPLQLALGRVQSALERTKKDAIQLDQKYHAFIELTERFLSQFIIMASVPDRLFLPLAIKDAYPHRHLRQRMRELPRTIEQLANNNDRITSLLQLLSTATYGSERRRHETTNIFIGILLVIIAIITPLQVLTTKNDIVSFFGAISASSIGRYLLLLVIMILLALLLYLCYNYGKWLMRRFKRRRDLRKASKFHKRIQEFWWLALGTTYLYKGKRDDCCTFLPLIPPSLDLRPKTSFAKQWNDGKRVDEIDCEATKQLEELLSPLTNPPTLTEKLLSSIKIPFTDLKHPSVKRPYGGKDVVRMARRLIYIFVLYPELIPLPRTLCILRYKSLSFLGAPAVRDNVFRDSLLCAGFTPKHVYCLRQWLEEKANQEWIKAESVNHIAEALKNAEVKASPPGHSLDEKVMEDWQGLLSQKLLQHL